MTQQSPHPSKVSRDHDSAWTGYLRNQPVDLGWEPTPTTYRMQLLVGGYLLVSGLLTALLTFSAEPSVRQATEKTIRDQNPDLTAGQLKSAVDFDMTIALTIAVLIGLVLVAFGVMTLTRRWSWLFYADLVICGLTGLGVFTGLFALARGSAGPLGLALPSLILSAAALALFIWMLVTWLQGTRWAARRIPAG